MSGSSVLIMGIVFLTFSGCTTPYRMQTTVSPSLDVCRVKTYVFLEPEDRTITHWLSDPNHRKSLEDLLRHSLSAKGLVELAANGEGADLVVRQHLESQWFDPSSAAKGSSENTENRFATWKVELAEGMSSPVLWSMQMDAVIADLEGHKLTHARAGLDDAFAGFPSCKKSSKTKVQ